MPIIVRNIPTQIAERICIYIADTCAGARSSAVGSGRSQDRRPVCKAIRIRFSSRRWMRSPKENSSARCGRRAGGALLVHGERAVAEVELSGKQQRGAKGAAATSKSCR